MDAAIMIFWLLSRMRLILQQLGTRHSWSHCATWTSKLLLQLLFYNPKSFTSVRVVNFIDMRRGRIIVCVCITSMRSRCYLLGLPRFYSASGIIAEMHPDGFATIVRKRCALMRRLREISTASWARSSHAGTLHNIKHYLQSIYWPWFRNKLLFLL